VPEPTEQRKTLGDAGQVDALCTELEGEIAALRAKYEQYFLGVDRKPPTVEHNALKKRVNSLRTTFVRQTATRFRVESVTSKLLTYERLWTRTLQEIEAGTYKRDIFKLNFRNKEKEKVAAPKPPEKKEEVKKAEVPGAAAVAPLAPAVKKPAPAPAAAVAGQLSDQKVKAIFDAYVMAKKRCNEDVSKISLDGLSQTLRKQVPELMKAHNAKSVEFKVVIKDGKAILRALPKDT